YADLPTGNADRSVDLWFKTSTSSGQLGLVDWGTPQNAWYNDFGVYLQNANQLVVRTWNQDAVFTLPRAYSDGAWHYIALSYTGSTKTLIAYLDGQSVGSGVFANALINTINASGLMVGRLVDCCYFNGTLDEVAIYPTALSATQVANHFTASG